MVYLHYTMYIQITYYVFIWVLLVRDILYFLFKFNLFFPSFGKMRQDESERGRPVWPDWAVFKGLGNKFYYKSSPNIFGDFGRFLWKRHILN